MKRDRVSVSKLLQARLRRQLDQRAVESSQEYRRNQKLKIPDEKKIVEDWHSSTSKDHTMKLRLLRRPANESNHVKDPVRLSGIRFVLLIDPEMVARLLSHPSSSALTPQTESNQEALTSP